MAKRFHSVTLDKDKCKGCINCIKRCPTQAIRVRGGKADILSNLCIDCGECIRVCPHHAKKAVTDTVDTMNNYLYKIALVPPSLYGQFNNITHPQVLADGLMHMGFDAVWDVSRAAELISHATRLMMSNNNLQRPVISPACPTVLRLIRVRFPNLVSRLLPLIAPVELAAAMAREEAQDKGVPQSDIGCIFLTPCPAKMTSIRKPLGSQKSSIDACVAIKDIYPLLLRSMDPDTTPTEPKSGRIGLGWAQSGGESAGLLTTENYLAADGIENVIAVLEDLEDNKYGDLDFVELNACPGGCVGGVLQVENPFLAQAKIKLLRRQLPMSVNHLTDDIPDFLFWDSDVKYSPAMELGKTKKESFALYAKVSEILDTLPGLDCGSCGAPTCQCFAEDVVRGHAGMNSCVVLLRRQMEQVIQQAGLEEAPEQGGKL